MKENTKTILYLGGAALVVYALYKSDVFKGLGQVSTGIGEGVEGIGSGVSSAFTGTGQAVGEFAQDLEGATENILSLLSPLGSLGVSVSKNIEQTATNKAAVRQETANKSFDAVTDIKAETEIFKAEQKSERVENRQELFTELQTYNPLNVLSNFIQSVRNKLQTSSNGATLTGAAISGGTSSTNSSIRTAKTATSSSYSTNSTSKLNFITNDKGVVTGIDTGTQSVMLNPSISTKKTSKLRTFLQNIF